MSSQRGNISRSRPPKHQNRTVFKNTLHDNSQTTKFINNLRIIEVCERCKNIIEWKIKYKKYKVLKAPVKCTVCEQKTVRHAYHVICLPCAKQREVCPKCCKKKEIVRDLRKEEQPGEEKQFKLDEEIRTVLKTISEKEHRTFLHYVNQRLKKYNSEQSISRLNMDANKVNCKDTHKNAIDPKIREDLMQKLKSLTVTEKEDDDCDSSADDISCNKN